MVLHHEFTCGKAVNYLNIPSKVSMVRANDQVRNVVELSCSMVLHHEFTRGKAGNSQKLTTKVSMVSVDDQVYNVVVFDGFHHEFTWEKGKIIRLKQVKFYL